MGDKKTELFINSQPSIVYPPKMIKEILPNFDAFEINELPIYFSTDCIQLYASIHSRVIKIFMMYNATKHDRFAYIWKKFVITLNLQIHIIINIR